MENDKLLSVKEVAQILGVNHQRVQALISQGRLPAQKIGNSYVIKESDLQLVADRPTGRPPKQTTDDAKTSRPKRAQTPSKRRK